MQEKLFEVFDEVGLPYYRQGSIKSEEDYDPSFFTFWNIDTLSTMFYDNDRKGKVWTYIVYYYTCDPSVIYFYMDKFIEVATSKGFEVIGNGRDALADRADWFGRYVQVKYTEVLE